MTLRIIFCVLFFSVSGSTISQKFEIEKQIKETKVPNAARSFMADSPFSEKVTWYLEKSQHGTSFEAKTFFQEHLWSVEFDEIGLIEDLEMTIELDELSENERAWIKNILGQIFKDYTIHKIQYHWESTPSKLKNFIQNYPASDDLSRWYEIVVTENTETSWKQKEVLINPAGKIVQNLEIITRPTDNMDF